ncbi:hypothetical protein DFH28DRAFT_916926 [Melampsora americana]|nr:hypothetical protein DFH28DRAFT_916926 [Melampsora americana]
MARAEAVCKRCNITFSTRTLKDEHHRVNHQLSVTVKTIHRDNITVLRGDDFLFKCPVVGCHHSVKNPRNLGSHVRICTGPSGVPVRRPIHNLAGQQVRVVPSGADIQVNETLRKYDLLWNTRCRILICATCHVGLPFKEMHSHHMNDDRTRDVDKDVMMDDLKEYEPMICKGPFPPDHVHGKSDKAIEGLLLYNGFTCKICQKSWKTMKSVINHFIENHKGECVQVLG